MPTSPPMDKAQENARGPLTGATGIHEVTNEKSRSQSKQDPTKTKGSRRAPPPGKGKPKSGAKIAANFSGNSGNGPQNKQTSGKSRKRNSQGSAGQLERTQEIGSAERGTVRTKPSQTNATNVKSTKKEAQGSSPQAERPHDKSKVSSLQRVKEAEKVLLTNQNGGEKNRTPQKPGARGRNGSPSVNRHKQDGSAGVKNSEPSPANKKKQSPRGTPTAGHIDSAPKKVDSTTKKDAVEKTSPENVVKEPTNGQSSAGSGPTATVQRRDVDRRRQVTGNWRKNAREQISSRDDSRGVHDNTTEEEGLERMGIFKLQKKKQKFPRARYFCRLCNYHMDDFASCEEHAAQTRHVRLMKNKIVAADFADVPDLLPGHLEALSEAIEAEVAEVGLTDEMLEERRAVMERVNSAIQEGMSDCQVDLYGSSLSGFGFKTSDVNLNIRTTGKLTAAEMLVSALSVIEKNKELFEDVGCKFEDKFPVIYFTDAESKLYCELGTGSDAAVATSKLLLRYRNHDPRARLLGIAFRHWACLLEIDRPREGSVPPYVYSLMAVYFLQRCEPPVLPVFQENEHLARTNTQALGELWVALFHFYLVKKNLEEEVISIKSRSGPTRKELNIQSRRIIVDDPCTPSKKSITKCLSSAEVFNFIMDCFHIALEYFSALSQGGGRTVTDQKTVPSKDSPPHMNHIREKSPPGITPDQPENLDEDAILNSLNSLVLDTSAVDRTSNSGDKADGSDDDPLDEKDLIDLSEDLVGTKQSLSETSDYDMSVYSIGITSTKHSFTASDFAFHTEKLSGGQEVPKICSNCQLEGHISQDCEEDKLPDLKPLPPMKDWFLTKIQQLCDYVSDQFSSNREELKVRSYVVQDLERFIQHHSEAKIRLALFGSSVNGFGFQNSDLDICMTFQNNETGDCLNVPEIIETLAGILRQHRDLYSVIPITTAKVPIVKFTHRPTALEGDISLYNLLAQRNTKLLSTYSAIDRRVCRLGHIVKAFVKECGIADASRGSLSSYAYILMTLFFLQQTRPPVIPVLQELYGGSTKPEKMVEGWNTWFYEHVNKLPTVWKGVGKNRQTEAELFLGFLRFYTEEFDFDKFVVCIRQHKPLTRFEKMWMGTNKGFTIEDPFDLDHNLGGALSRRMSNYITLIFRQGRQRFGTPYQKLPSKTYNFFFNYDFLTDGQPPPNDRGCRICGKIGHYVKDCPIKLRGKERKKAKAATANTPQKKPQHQGGTPQAQRNTPQNQGNTPQTQGTTPNRQASSNQAASNTTRKSEISERREDPKTNSGQSGREHTGRNSQESLKQTASNKNNNQQERPSDGEVKATESPGGAAKDSSTDREEKVVNSDSKLDDDELQQATLLDSNPTPADIPGGTASPTPVQGIHSVNDASPMNEPASSHPENVAAMSQGVSQQKEDMDLNGTSQGSTPSPMATLQRHPSPHEVTPPGHPASQPRHHPSPPRYYQSPPGHHASPPQPIRTPDKSIPYHGTPPTRGPPSGQPGLPGTPTRYPYPGFPMLPHGHGQNVPGQFWYNSGPVVPQPSRELMMFMNVQQMRPGFLGPRPGMASPGQVVPAHEQSSRQGNIPGQRQDMVAAGHGNSPHHTGAPPGRYNTDWDRNNTVQSMGTPPRQGNTPPRQDHTPPRGVTPPRHSATSPQHSATPPRHGATPPHSMVTPMIASPVTPYQNQIPPLMSVPLGVSPSSMTAHGSTPPTDSLGPAMMVGPQMGTGPPPGSPHAAGQMVYPSHPGASPLMIGQSHHGVPMVPGTVPPPLMGQQLPPMHMNGDLHLAQATVNIQQMLGLGPGGHHIAGPQPEMGLAPNAQGGPR